MWVVNLVYPVNVLIEYIADVARGNLLRTLHRPSLIIILKQSQCLYIGLYVTVILFFSPAHIHVQCFQAVPVYMSRIAGPP